MAIEISPDRPRATVRYTPRGARIECETRLDADREFVWEVIHEPTRRVEWDARLIDCTLLTPRPLGKGARTRTMHLLLGALDIEYTSWQPVARSGIKAAACTRNPIQSLVASWNFTPVDASSTIWKTQIVVRGIGGHVLAPYVERLVIGPLLRWQTVISAGNLKRVVGREYAALQFAASTSAAV
jgi:hypothetical protein